jgi:hypothetical protein
MAVLGMHATFPLLNPSSTHTIQSARSSPSDSCSISTFTGLRVVEPLRVKATSAAATNSRNSVVVSALEEDHNREVVEAEGVVGRRAVLAATSALSFAGFLGGVEGAVAAEDVISDWEQVTLPVNPGVVLLDLAFVPDQPQRGL